MKVSIKLVSNKLLTQRPEQGISSLLTNPVDGRAELKIDHGRRLDSCCNHIYRSWTKQVLIELVKIWRNFHCRIRELSLYCKSARPQDDHISQLQIKRSQYYIKNMQRLPQQNTIHHAPPSFGIFKNLANRHIALSLLFTVSSLAEAQHCLQ